MTRVALNEETMPLLFATKHFGGPGFIGEHKVGLYLKNIVFSGMGLTENPASLESVILSYTMINGYQDKIKTLESQLQELKLVAEKKEDNVMEDKVKEFEAKILELQTLLDTASKSIAEKDSIINGMVEEKKQMQEEMDKAKKECENVASANTALVAEKTALDSKIAEATQTIATTQDKYENLVKEKDALVVEKDSVKTENAVLVEKCMIMERRKSLDELEVEMKDEEIKQFSNESFTVLIAKLKSTVKTGDEPAKTEITKPEFTNEDKGGLPNGKTEVGYGKSVLSVLNKV
jgi:chromosome segregation ATPase